MDKREIADYLKVSARTVDYMMRDGSLPYLKFNRLVRFKKSYVDDHLKKQFGVGVH